MARRTFDVGKNRGAKPFRQDQVAIALGTNGRSGLLRHARI
jgi:hypothetical protein